MSVGVMDELSRGTIELERERSNRFVKITFGLMAMVFSALGLLITGFADSFGLPPDTAQPVAIGFLCTAIAGTGVLYIWDRVFQRHG